MLNLTELEKAVEWQKEVLAGCIDKDCDSCRTVKVLISFAKLALSLKEMPGDKESPNADEYDEDEECCFEYDRGKYHGYN